MKNLTEMNSGDTAVIYQLEAKGCIRRRLMDIGMIPGTKIECLQKSPLGDPVAFLVRRTVIALRCEDAFDIFICEQGDESCLIK